MDRAGPGGAGHAGIPLGLLQDGALFGIYQEGTRSPDGRLYRGRTGIGWLALSSACR